MASPPSFTTSQTTITSSASNLPTDLSPSSLDTLPVLASILARLQTSQNNLTATASPLPTTQSSSTSQPQSQTHSLALNPFSTTPLSTKDIPAATDGLKHRLQKARAQVARLPDIDRGLDEQEAEIKELESKIEAQRKVLMGLRDLGLKAGAAQEKPE